MIEWFSSIPHPLQALIATLFTWGITALGSALVFLTKKINKTFMDGMLGFSAGVMIAASFWSLIVPALAMSDKLGINSLIIVTLGFLCGGLFLFISDNVFKVYNKRHPKRKKESKSDSFHRSLMLIMSITLHNIPEGMAIGVAFGSLAYGLDGATLMGAIALAIGIGLQNFPEGSAVSFPLRREGYSRCKSFFYGQASGIVEPIAAVFGALMVIKIRFVLPFFLALAAGCMIYVVIEELVPESQTNKQKDLMALFTLFGFVVMMILDIALG